MDNELDALEKNLDNQFRTLELRFAYMIGGLKWLYDKTLKYPVNFLINILEKIVNVFLLKEENDEDKWF